MPIKLIDPRAGKTPNFSIRGTHHGQYVDRTTGTADRKKATKYLNKVRDEIERGVFTPKGSVTFAKATLSYLRNGGEDTFLGPLVDYFGEAPLLDIDQAAIDEAAHFIYPNASPATRNRQVYTPVSAILKHSKVEYPIRRPKGAQGTIKTEWMTPPQAERLLDAAEARDPEFRTFLAILLYTGARLSEVLNMGCQFVDLSEAMIFIPKTKNSEPRAIYLPPALIAELANHPRGLDRPKERLCRFRKNGHLYNLMKDAKRAAELPDVTFHTFRHTWATWMRRYAKLDTKGLVGTGAWKDEKSAARYQHVVVTEEAQRADLLPVVKSGKRGKSVE
jgi:integrase